MFKTALIISTFALCAQAFADHIVVLPQGDLPWSATPEGAEFAALHGDRFVQSYMAMVRLPAGLSSPPHIKSANMFGVVMEGAFTHTTGDGADGEPVHLGPGSYYHIPAGLPHVSSCVSSVPCVAFLYQDGAFDFNVVKQ